jgi:cytochrome c oxidase assembly protein subunit 15
MKRAKQLRALSLATLLAVLFLIWVGGMVRATGAGMGCPDWPTCFGQIIPPLSEADLPADYQQRWADKGYAETPFNAVKTWTEYLNRLTGTLIGFLALLTLLAAFLHRRLDPRSAWFAAGAFVLVGFNGWIGAMLVETHLHGAVVTAHMLLSFGVVLLLLGVVTRSWRGRLSLPPAAHRSARPWLQIALVLTVLQTGLGTQVRERVDAIAAAAADFHERGDWIAQIGTALTAHTTLGLLVVVVNLALAARLWQTGISGLARMAGSAIALVVLLQAGLGLWLVLGDLPIPVQPLHLLGVAVLLTFQGLLLMAPAHTATGARPAAHGPAIRGSATD